MQLLKKTNCLLPSRRWTFRFFKSIFQNTRAPILWKTKPLIFQQCEGVAGHVPQFLCFVSSCIFPLNKPSNDFSPQDDDVDNKQHNRTQLGRQRPYQVVPAKAFQTVLSTTKINTKLTRKRFVLTVELIAIGLLKPELWTEHKTFVIVSARQINVTNYYSWPFSYPQSFSSFSAFTYFGTCIHWHLFP